MLSEIDEKRWTSIPGFGKLNLSEVVNTPLIFLEKDDFDDKQRITMESITNLPENNIPDCFPIIHQVGCDEGDEADTYQTKPPVSHRYRQRK